MRAREAEEVVSLFRGHYNIPLIHADASELFLSRLEGIFDPEQKRKIIGAASSMVRRRSEENRQRRIFGAGHALPPM